MSRRLEDGGTQLFNKSIQFTRCNNFLNRFVQLKKILMTYENELDCIHK